MHRELLENLHQYFEQKHERSHQEEVFYQDLQGRSPYFPITYISRDDLASQGFDTSKVDDCTMETIADKMSDAYCDNGYWMDLDIIAEDRVPKYKCPKCWDNAREYTGEICYCNSCNHQWKVLEPTGRYVLVEGTESSFFEENEIGLECYNSDDNGARYIPERIYVDHFDKAPKINQIYLPIAWPDSQGYLEWEHTAKKMFARCEYINPADTQLELGRNALWVPQSLIKK